MIKNILGFKSKFLFFISAIVSFLLIFLITISQIISDSIKLNMIKNQIGTNPNKVEITAKKELIKGFFFKNQSLEEIYKNLEKNPNIKEVWGIYSFSLPSQAIIQFGPINFSTDVFLFASDKGDLCFSGKYIALGINPLLINIYNSQIANTNFFPKLNPTSIKQITFKVIFGKNSLIKENKNIQKKAKIVVLDNDLPAFGLTIGYKVAKEIDKNFGGNHLKLIKIIAILKNHNYIKTLIQKYEGNFNIKTYQNISEEINEKLKGFSLIITVLNGVIIFLLLAYLVNYTILTSQSKSYIIKTLIYHKKEKYLGFLSIFVPVSLAFLVGTILNLILISTYNYNIGNLENSLANQGYFIALAKANTNSLIVLASIVIILVMFLAYINYWSIKRKTTK